MEGLVKGCSFGDDGFRTSRKKREVVKERHEQE